MITVQTHMYDAAGYARVAREEMESHGHATWQNKEMHDAGCTASAAMLLDCAAACVVAAESLQ